LVGCSAGRWPGGIGGFEVGLQVLHQLLRDELGNAVSPEPIQDLGQRGRARPVVFSLPAASQAATVLTGQSVVFHIAKP
jgi:hypothetical protein